jgi:deoxyhypusine synthase
MFSKSPLITLISVKLRTMIGNSRKNRIKSLTLIVDPLQSLSEFSVVSLSNSKAARIFLGGGNHFVQNSDLFYEPVSRVFLLS